MRFTMWLATTYTIAVEAIVLNEMDQGAPFTQCVLIDDWETKTLADDITLVDRSAGSGCCPVGSVPGQWLTNQYQSSQIVCGFAADGTVSRNLGTSDACTYGLCYMRKQHLECADGSRQRLNGCCGVGNARLSFAYQDGGNAQCIGYERSPTNIHGETAEYCETYHTDYSSCGNKGTADTSDDIVGGVLVPDNLYEYAQCVAGSCAPPPAPTPAPPAPTPAPPAPTLAPTTPSCTGGAAQSTATRLGDMEQGQVFTGCILISDWETKTLNDEITLRNRNSCGCCPAGTVPGEWLYDSYQGAQVVCGFDASDGSVSRNMGTTSQCSYGTCYLYKQDLDCADGSKQLLNGCCSAGTRGEDRLSFGFVTGGEQQCLGYEDSRNNIHGETAEYCRSYHREYSACGNKGTTADSDDIVTGNLVPANIYEYARCAATSCSGTGGGSTGSTNGGSSGGGTCTGGAAQSSTTRLSNYDQGQAFTGCILISDWETKTLNDEITLRNRNSCGCCPAGTVPGEWLVDSYQGAQVVCGFDASDGSVSRSMGNTGRCTYGSCYVYKQNLECADGSRQLLNGCCGAGTRSANRLSFAEDLSCVGNEYSRNNIHGESAEYCRTYRSNYGTCGYKGTTQDSDDIHSPTSGTSVLVPANLYEYTRCGIAMADGCPSASGEEPDDSGGVRTTFQIASATLLLSVVL